jgi:hypothetical protein
MVTIRGRVHRTLRDSKSNHVGEIREHEIHLVLGEDVAVNGSIRGKPFRSFHDIGNRGCLAAFEPRVRQ